VATPLCHFALGWIACNCNVISSCVVVAASATVAGITAKCTCMRHSSSNGKRRTTWHRVEICHLLLQNCYSTVKACRSRLNGLHALVAQQCCCLKSLSLRLSCIQVDTGNDPNNGGACGNNCTAAANVASATCVNTPKRRGICGITSCEPGFSDCDGDASNGCETPYDACPCSATCDDDSRRRCAEDCARRGGRFNAAACVCLTACRGSLADCDKDGSCEVRV
jgi:hypothetical protein